MMEGHESNECNESNESSERNEFNQCFFCNFEIKTRVLLTTSLCPVVVMAVIPIRLGFTGTPVDFECDQKLKLVSFKKEVLMTLLQKDSVSSQMLDDFEFFTRVSYDTGSFRGFQGLQQKSAPLWPATSLATWNESPSRSRQPVRIPNKRRKVKANETNQVRRGRGVLQVAG